MIWILTLILSHLLLICIIDVSLVLVNANDGVCRIVGEVLIKAHTLGLGCDLSLEMGGGDGGGQPSTFLNPLKIILL